MPEYINKPINIFQTRLGRPVQIVYFTEKILLYKENKL